MAVELSGNASFPFAGINMLGDKELFQDETSAYNFSKTGGQTGTIPPVADATADTATPPTPDYTQTQMQDLFEQAGIPWDVPSPQQQFRQYATQQFRPGGYNPMREAFWGSYNPLMQQYYLGAPTMTQPGGSFADFMGGYTSPQANLRQSAERAAAIANLTQGQFMEYASPQAGYAGEPIGTAAMGQIEALTPAQQLMYRQTYGTGEQSEQNRRQLANMLALQRTPTTEGQSGGVYGGIMGQAIQGAMNELYEQLIGQTPGANFLDWYLGRTSGLAGLTGKAATPAVTNGNGTQV